MCTRLVVVTDGFASDPEMQLFFTELPQRAHAQQLLLQAGRPGNSGDGAGAGGVLEIPHQCVYDPLNGEVRVRILATRGVENALLLQAAAASVAHDDRCRQRCRCDWKV